MKVFSPELDLDRYESVQSIIFVFCFFLIKRAACCAEKRDACYRNAVDFGLHSRAIVCTRVLVSEARVEREKERRGEGHSADESLLLQPAKFTL